MSAKVSILLDELERVLRQNGFWADVPPTEQALASQEPFCIDTLTFTEWLQWVYISRLKALINQNAALPQGASIHPYAEEALKGYQDGKTELLDLILRLDKAMA